MLSHCFLQKKTLHPYSAHKAAIAVQSKQIRQGPPGISAAAAFGTHRKGL